MNDVEIKAYSITELIEKLEPYIKRDDLSKEKSQVKPVDTSKSGKEWAEICRLVKKGKSKEEIFKEMEAFKKWSEGTTQYREKTYSKALLTLGEKQEESKLEDVIKGVDESNFDYLSRVTKSLYKTYKRKNIKKGEDMIVSFILYNYHIRTPEDSKDIFIYNDGIYEPNGEAVIGKLVERILMGENTNHYTNEIIGHITRRTYTKREDFVEPLHLICLQNGLLNINSMEMEPFDPKYIFLNKITPSFNKEAKCPKIEMFLREVIIKKADWNNPLADTTDILTLQEFVGYLLYKKVIFNRAVMFYGDGENGKSTCINLIKRFLGDRNVANIAIQKLESNNFAVAALQGKLANLHSDLPKTALKETSKFKQLTGGDSVNAEKKFKDTFSFIPYAKMMFAANTLPATYDDTRAFWRRWLIFWFPNIFEEKKDETRKNILDELTTEEELSGFLNWAIEGLKRLLEKNKFTINRSTNEIREEYIRKSDSIGAFILDMVEENSGTYILKRELYEAYGSYCRQRAYDIVSENTFHRRFYQKVNVREYNPKVEAGKQKQAWSGVKFKTPTKTNTNNDLDHSFEEDNEDIGLDEYFEE